MKFITRKANEPACIYVDLDDFFSFEKFFRKLYSMYCSFKKRVSSACASFWGRFLRNVFDDDEGEYFFQPLQEEEQDDSSDELVDELLKTMFKYEKKNKKKKWFQKGLLASLANLMKREEFRE